MEVDCLWNIKGQGCLWDPKKPPETFTDLLPTFWSFEKGGGEMKNYNYEVLNDLIIKVQ